MPFLIYCCAAYPAVLLLWVAELLISWNSLQDKQDIKVVQAADSAITATTRVIKASNSPCHQGAASCKGGTATAGGLRNCAIDTASGQLH
jgi:hypothetical protein